MIYSLQERKIGSWLGEDLYQKTIALNLSQIDEETRVLDVEFENDISLKKVEVIFEDNDGNSWVSDISSTLTRLIGSTVSNVITTFNNNVLIANFLSAVPAESLPATLEFIIGSAITTNYTSAYATVFYTKNS